MFPRFLLAICSLPTYLFYFHLFYFLFSVSFSVLGFIALKNKKGQKFFSFIYG